MVDFTKDRANIPSSPACGQWETLLVDALDGLLRPEDEAVFSNHMATCSACTALFEEARRGREWLEFLAPEPEVPVYLLDRILGETGPGRVDVDRLSANLGLAGAMPAGGNVLAMPPVWQRPGFSSRMRRFAEPRLMMTAAMAFFSIALTMSITGVRISSVSMADLRPTSLKSYLEKHIMTASTPVVRYYDHLRFVYEVESRMKELRRSTDAQRDQQNNQQKSQPTPANPGPGGEVKSHPKDGGPNPSDAPQQTVNPTSPLWGDELLQARLEMPVRRQPEVPVAQVSEAFSKPKRRSGSSESGGLAMPERSNPCSA